MVIVYGDPPRRLCNPVVKTARCQVGSQELLLTVDSIARYHVQQGRRITVAPKSDAAHEAVLLFLLGSAMGALLHQRGTLILHAGAVAVHRSAFIFSGPSGIGKSTLAAGFHQRAYRFLADDLCVVNGINGKPMVMPGFPWLKLWPDVACRLGHDRDRLSRVQLGMNRVKYFLPINTVPEDPVPLKAAYMLTQGKADAIKITPLSGLSKIHALLAGTYRPNFLQHPEVKTDHFRRCAAVADSISVYRVSRPTGGFLLDELLDELEEKFEDE